MCCFSVLLLSNLVMASLSLCLSPPRSLLPSVVFTAGQWLTVAFPPLPNQWHWLGLLIELGWRSNSNVQQMAGAFLHSTSRGPHSVPQRSAQGNVIHRGEERGAERATQSP